jgi:hypothetical protein
VSDAADDPLEDLQRKLRGGASPTQIVEDYENNLSAAAQARRAADRQWLYNRAMARLYGLLEDAKRVQESDDIRRIIAVIDAMSAARQQAPSIAGPKPGGRRRDDPPA